ncbi:AraC family transcriptional regulator [Paenibacillus sp. MMS20-IR301]|uniref:helix-turn-helix domain-containing protein n=1 Tax=Paenibacillus sp. MMS20-IR301 TaxID=2895946 RepID=UPI0028F04A46|nr:AraC family transcriptional regulator [Paenibacillus sp. MMS20-IR301]WNS45468.1 AraC family transcriptional regulator [Paenibacillus sp. MMS20-IR301]
MTYPKELKEYPQLEENTYPFRLFFNHCPDAKPEQNILFLHWHEHFEIIIMREGRAIFHVDSKPYEAGPGDVLMVPSGGLHVGYSLQRGDISYVSIVFHASLFKDLSQDTQHELFVAPYLSNLYQFPVNPARQNPVCADYYHVLERIIDEAEAKEPAYQLVIKNLLHLYFTLLSRTFPPRQMNDRGHSINRERFKPLLALLESHVDQQMTLESAARFVNLNLFHFCKTFKKLTGRTFVDYVNQCRMNEAQRLLLETGLSITEISGRVGCDNPNYFTKLYKQYKGQTPSQARKKQHR